MAAYLNGLDYFLIGACFVLNIAGFVKIADPALRSFRYYMLMLIVKKILLLATLHNQQLYFDLYWYLEMVALSWLAYICGHIWQLAIPISNQLITKTPCLIVVGMSLYYCPTTYRTNAMMLNYRDHALAICLFVLISAFVFATARKYMPMAQAMITVVLMGLAISTLWLLGLRSATGELVAEGLSVWLLITASKAISRTVYTPQSDS